MKQKKQPKYLGDIVIVIVKVELQSGVIVLPQDHRQHHMQPAEVVGIGSTCSLKDDLKVGELVIVDLHLGTRIKLDGKEAIVYDTEDIKGKFES